MSARRDIKVTVLQKDVYGSLSSGDHDTVIGLIDWLQTQLAEVPEQFRSDARIDVDSVGGWEGEHHVEIAIYYYRPETDAEQSARINKERTWLSNELARVRNQYERAQTAFDREYGAAPHPPRNRVNLT